MNRLTLSIPVSSADYMEPSCVHKVQVGEVYLDPGLLTRAQRQQLLQELDCLYNFLIRLTKINIFRRYLYIQLTSFPVAYRCTLARELVRQSDIPMLEKGLDHLFHGLAHFRRLYLGDEPASCRLTDAKVVEKVCCLLVTDHEVISLVAQSAHSSYRASW